MRPFSILSYVAFIGIGLVVAAVGWAFGQDAVPASPTDTVVEFESFFGWLRPYIMELMSLAIGAAVLWTTKRFHDLTGINIESKHREALQSALRNGANLVLEKIPDDVSVDVKSSAVAAGIRYVLESVPDAVKYFDLTPEKIAELLKPKIVAPPTVIITDSDTKILKE